jgi:hypothetical protein
MKAKDITAKEQKIIHLSWIIDLNIIPKYSYIVIPKNKS